MPPSLTDKEEPSPACLFFITSVLLLRQGNEYVVRLLISYVIENIMCNVGNRQALNSNWPFVFLMWKGLLLLVVMHYSIEQYQVLGSPE